MGMITGSTKSVITFWIVIFIAVSVFGLALTLFDWGVLTSKEHSISNYLERVSENPIVGLVTIFLEQLPVIYSSEDGLV